MKINEISINENKYDFIRKALPRVERLPGETVVDAIKRATSEIGGVKSADNLVSPEKMAALRRDPVPPSSGPAVWRNPRTGEVSSRPFSGSDDWPGRRPLPGPRVTIDQLRTPANGPAAMNIDSAKKAAQANAAKKAPAAKPAPAPAAKPAETPADDLAKQIKPGDDAAGVRQDPSIDTPVDDLAKQIKPGAGPTPPGGQAEPGMSSAAASDTVTMPRDFADRLLSLAERNPAAAKAAAEKAGIPWGKIVGYPTAALAATVGAGTAWDAMTPDYVPKVPPILNAKNWVPTITPTKNTGSTEPENLPSVVAPTDDQLQTIRDNDPAYQAAQKNLERAIKDAQSTNESTSELNRLVYLSRL